MIEKMNPDRFDNSIDNSKSGYWKPKGKWCKRSIHKLARRINNLDTNRKGIYNRIGVYWEWN
jgi:hypothetical protein